MLMIRGRVYGRMKKKSRAPVGGGVLLANETDGWATDFLHPVDLERVVLKTAGTSVSYGTSFFTNAGTSSKWVYNAAGVLVNVPVGSLALDYDPLTHSAKGLCSEPQATNTTRRNSEFDHAAWGKYDGHTVGNVVAAPNGLLEADAWVPETGLRTPFTNIASDTTPTGGTFTSSLYMKNGPLGTNWVRLQVASTGSWQVWFNLATGARGSSVGSPVNYTITALANGWYRVTLTFVAGQTTTNTYIVAVPTDGSSDTVTGDGVKAAFYMWNAQVEPGNTATSPIPNPTDGVVTREADQVKVTPASINYSATAGSWWVDVEFKSFVSNDFVVSNIPSGNTALFVNSTTTFGLYDGVAYILKTVPTILGSHKLAAAFASADRAVTADGLAPGIDTQAGAALLSPGTGIQFGGQATVNTPNCYIRKLRYVPRRKTNAELVTETT